MDERLTLQLYPEDAAVLLALVQRVETIADMAALGVTLWRLRRMADALGQAEPIDHGQLWEVRR